MCFRNSSVFKTVAYGLKGNEYSIQGISLKAGRVAMRVFFRQSNLLLALRVVTIRSKQKCLPSALQRL